MPSPYHSMEDGVFLSGPSIAWIDSISGLGASIPSLLGKNHHTRRLSAPWTSESCVAISINLNEQDYVPSDQTWIWKGKWPLRMSLCLTQKNSKKTLASAHHFVLRLTQVTSLLVLKSERDHSLKGVDMKAMMFGSGGGSFIYFYYKHMHKNNWIEVQRCGENK